MQNWVAFQQPDQLQGHTITQISFPILSIPILSYPILSHPTLHVDIYDYLSYIS